MKKTTAFLLVAIMLFSTLAPTISALDAETEKKLQDTYGIAVQELFEKYPEYLYNESFDSYISENLKASYSDILHDYQNKTGFLAYISGLKNGSKIIGREVLSLTGSIESNREKILYDTVLAFMQEAMANESLVAEIAATIDANFSDFKTINKLSNLGQAAIVEWLEKACKHIPEEEIEDLFTSLLKEGNNIIKKTKVSFEVFELVIAAFQLQEFNLEMIERLLLIVPEEGCLYEGLLLLQAKMMQNPYDYIISNFFNDEAIGFLDEIIKGIFSGGAVTVAGLLIKLFAFSIYHGPSSEELAQATYFSACVNELQLLVNDMRYKFFEKKVYNKTVTEQEIQDYEFIVSLYFIAVRLTYEYTTKMVYGERLQIYDEIEDILTYDNYIKLCLKEVSDNEKTPEEAVLEKINTLTELLEGKYFTVNQKACTNKSHASCDNCKNTNVFEAEWFKDIFGDVKIEQIPEHFWPNGSGCTASAWTCAGFANFAQWYIFATDSNSVVTNKRIIGSKTDYANGVKFSCDVLDKYAKPGDIIRDFKSTYSNGNQNGHSYIYVSHDSEGAWVLDCNYWWNDNGVIKDVSRVKYHKILYTERPYPIAITRADNYDSVSTSNPPTSTTTTKTQYRYYHYTDGTHYSVCAYSGKSKYGGTWTREDTGWLDAPLTMVSKSSTSFVHTQQGSACTNAGCTDSSWEGGKYEDASGTAWFREETRTVAAETQHTHTYNSGAITKAATCASTGIKTYTCTGCGETKTETVAATGTHTYGAWTVTTPAKAGVAGVETRTCSVCGNAETRSIAALADYTTYTQADESDFEYTVENGRITITAYKGKAASLIIPDKLGSYFVTKIANGAFNECNTLKRVILPKYLQSMEDAAFYKCTALEEVTIPKNLEEAGYSYFTFSCSAFVECPALKTVHFEEGTTVIATYLFQDCTGIESITIPDTVTEIKGSAFCGAINLKNVVFGNSVARINDFGFINCVSLETIALPNSLAEIGGYAFAECMALESITIPNSVTTIEHYAFENCVSLTNVKIGSSVTEIGHHAFSGCIYLESVEIPASVTGIGWSAFPQNTTIRCVKGSAADMYAQENNLPVEYITKYANSIVMTIDSTDALVYNEAAKTDVAPIIVNNRTMLPARFVAENLGATVAWDAAARKATIVGNGVTIELYIDSTTAYVNGVAITLDSPAFIQNNRTYTPVRFIAETLGATVEWDAANRQAILTK